MKNLISINKNFVAAIFMVAISIFAAKYSVAAQTVTDAHIGHIVTIADGLDIDYGKIALKRSKNKQVKEFAQRMVTDHEAVQKAVEALAAKLGLTPEDNDTSRSLVAGGIEVKAKLNSLKGKAFDKYYIDNEVKYHAFVVNATENVLIANAKNAELKEALVNTLPLFKRHLEHCQMIQASFNKGKKTDMNMSH
jgi:putative membrane protein